MPRVIDLADDRPASLAECVDALAASGFDPGDEESLHHAAGWLRRLGNDQDFLGDVLIDLLRRHPAARNVARHVRLPLCH